MKLGVIDVGGGMRGIYAAGVLDYCLDKNIHFDLGIGISAGSANLASYFAGQARRNLQFYSEYAMRKEYMGLGNFVRNRSFIDLDYVYGTLSNSDGENPLNFHALYWNPAEFYVLATDAETGMGRYFEKDQFCQDHYDCLKGSSAIPFVCRPYVIDGIPYYDGALADPVPVQKAFDLGCDKVILILTLPEDTVRTNKKDRKLAAGIRKIYPLAARQMELRAKHYNEGVALARTYAQQGKLLIVAPDNTCGVNTLKREPASLRQLYEKGYRDGQRVLSFL